jgi:indolepyruvate ferredoxin oxidoreductase
MGGEGVPWVGQAPFTETKHVFANLGDGTYSHSGLLAIRQAVVSKVPITYKILFNDAVAMTGGQPVEGTLTVPEVVRQVSAEGIERIVVVTDDPARHPDSGLPAGVPVRHRRELDAVQREMREYPGVSVIVYDQTCAAEKRRRRKRGLMPDPARRVVINDRVCEGCGDCSAKSNCMSVVPVETEFGRKRAIDQSSCNKDFSCLEGFCPSFVTVEGGRLRKGKAAAPVGEAAFNELPEPLIPPVGRPYGILVAGVGGTGVITIGALLGTAATLEGKGVSVLDMAGLAQKGGPVWSHIRIAARQDLLHASRMASGEADLLLGCDIVVAVADESLSKLHAGTTRAVVNSDFSVTSDFVRTFAAQARTGDIASVRDPQFPVVAIEEQIMEAVGPGQADFVAGTRLATALLGDSIATNLFMVGYAYQKGLLPLSAASILQAIELNGAAVEMNQDAFLWGRRAVLDLASVERVATPPEAVPAHHRLSVDLHEMVARRVAELTAYQDARYAQRYADLVRRAREVEVAKDAGPYRARRGRGDGATTSCSPPRTSMRSPASIPKPGSWNGWARPSRVQPKLVFHLAPPLWAKPDPTTGEPRKRAFGPWVLRAFKVLARLRRVRGTALDPFRFSEDRKLDRRLLDEYERLVGELLASLRPGNHALAVELASLPDQIRGYGPIRRRHAEHAKRQEARLLEEFRGKVEGPDEGDERVPEAPVLVRG